MIMIKYVQLKKGLPKRIKYFNMHRITFATINHPDPFNMQYIICIVFWIDRYGTYLKPPNIKDEECRFYFFTYMRLPSCSVEIVMFSLDQVFSTVPKIEISFQGLV